MGEKDNNSAGGEKAPDSLNLSVNDELHLIKEELRYVKEELNAAREELNLCQEKYESVFSNNQSIILIINPETGEIRDANRAASKFYGWSKEELCSKRITDINIITPEEASKEMQTALEEKRNYFQFRHLLANGEIREVDVYSGPVSIRNESLLLSVVHDVTEIRKIKNYLTDSEQRWKLVLDTVEDGIWDSRFSDKFADTGNRRSYRELTYSQNYFHQDDGNENQIMDLIRNLERIILERTAQLNSASERLKLATRAGNIGVWDWDIKNNRLHWDEKMLELYGINREMLHENPDVWLQYIHPDDKEQLRNDLNAAISGKKEFNNQFRIIRPDGLIRYIKALASVIKNDNDDEQHMIGTSFDVTEWHETVNSLNEKATLLSYLLLSIPDIVFFKDLNGVYLGCNEEFARIVDHKIEEINGVTDYDLFPREIADFFREQDRIMLKNGEPRHNEEWVTYPDQSKRYLDTFKAPVYDKNGNIFGLMGISRDITERFFSQEELQKSKKEAEAANMAKSLFLANMSHEIRTPMNAVIGYSELLNSTKLDSVQKNYITSIISSGKSLLTIINDILDLSKIEAGKLELEYGFVNTHIFFPEFEIVFALKVRQKGLEFIIDIAEGTPESIYVDEARLRQIIFNLIGNAIKFTSAGHIILRIYTANTHKSDSENDLSDGLTDLIIEVEDTGTGISGDMLGKIFEPFEQEHEFRDYGGTGLGLAINKRLTNLMNGEITIRSELGKGSVFTIVLPEVEYRLKTHPFQSDDQFNPADVHFEKAVLLIVDDVRHNRSYIVDALKDTDFRIFEANNGLTGYVMAKELKPDLIISDIRMPELDGFGLLEKIKGDSELLHIPVLAYSASVINKQRQNILNSKFAGLLIKPVRLSELYAELMKILPYKLTGEKSDRITEQESDNPESILDISGLLAFLDGDFTAQWEKFSLRQPIGAVRVFGKQLKELGEKHSSNIVTAYGKELFTAADNFNIEGILSLVKKFPSIVEEIRQLAKD